MLTPEVESALLATYGRIPNQRGSYYQTELSERVLDELVANPDRTQDPQWQVRNARRNAAKVLKKRLNLAPAALFEDIAEIDAPDSPDAVAAVELTEWVMTTESLTGDERTLLLSSMESDEALAELARTSGTPIQRLREQLSRTRTRARAAWLRDSAL